MIIDYGFRLQLIKDIAIAPDKALDIAKDFFNSKIIITIFSTIVLFTAVDIVAYPTETVIIIAILWFGSILHSFAFFFNAIFKGLNKFHFETYPTIVLNATQFFFITVLLYIEYKTVAIALAMLVSRIIYLVMSFYLVAREIGMFSFSFDFKRGIHVLMTSFPYGIHAILSTLYLQIDTVFLSYFSGNANVGVYQMAMRIVLATMIVNEIMVSSYFPIIAKKLKSDIAGFRKDGIALNKYLLLIGGFAAVGLFVYAEYLIHFLYGSQYSSAIIILQMLSLVILIRFILTSYAAFITISGNQKLRSLSVALSLLINIILNLYFIPLYGARGAACTSIITHLFLLVLYFTFSLRMTQFSFINAYWIKGFLMIGCLMPICLLLNTISIALSMVIFLILTVAISVQILNLEEKVVIYGFIKRLLK